jgi:hypothetical protein
MATRLRRLRTTELPPVALGSEASSGYMPAAHMPDTRRSR